MPQTKQHIYPNIYIYICQEFYLSAKPPNGNRFPCGGTPSLTPPRTRERGRKKPPLPMGDKGWGEGPEPRTHRTYAQRHCELPQEAWQSSLSRGSSLDCFAALAMTRVMRKSCKNEKGPPLEEKAPKRLPKTRNWVYQRKWAKDLLASAMRCVSSRFLRAAPVSLAASIISEARRSRMVRSLRERAAVMIQRMDSA
jgi:hypothetical protein